MRVSNNFQVPAEDPSLTPPTQGLNLTNDPNAFQQTIDFDKTYNNPNFYSVSTTTSYPLFDFNTLTAYPSHSYPIFDFNTLNPYEQMNGEATNNSPLMTHPLGEGTLPSLFEYNELSREDFVSLVSRLILEIKENIHIVNQVSGYMAFHKEIKQNKYFDKIRALINRNEKNNGYSIFYNSELVRFTKMAQCIDLAELLCADLALELYHLNVKATLSVVESTLCDHGYILVAIKLANENKEESLWEIDAWDPRIIDRTEHVDQPIKNKNALIYGTAVKINYTINIDPKDNAIESIIEEQKKQYLADILSLKLQKPKKGPSSRSVTPERELIQKHAPKMYVDYLVADASKAGRFPGFFSTGGTSTITLQSTQKASPWQQINRRNPTF